jgi:ABC-type oligopeptide transport system ATPase subunit
VNEVSLRIAEGESLGLAGESGSGKTMLSQTGAAEQVLHHPKNDYTRELLSAVPELPRA